MFPGVDLEELDVYTPYVRKMHFRPIRGRKRILLCFQSPENVPGGFKCDRMSSCFCLKTLKLKEMWLFLNILYVSVYSRYLILRVTVQICVHVM